MVLTEWWDWQITTDGIDVEKVYYHPFPHLTGMESTKTGALPYVNTGIWGSKNHRDTVFHCIISYWWWIFCWKVENWVKVRRSCKNGRRQLNLCRITYLHCNSLHIPYLGIIRPPQLTIYMHILPGTRFELWPMWHLVQLVYKTWSSRDFKWLSQNMSLSWI
jgi:hypothetical protein